MLTEHCVLSRKIWTGEKVDPRSNICLPKMDRVDQKLTWLERMVADVSGLEEAEGMPRLSLFWVTIQKMSEQTLL